MNNRKKETITTFAGPLQYVSTKDECFEEKAEKAGLNKEIAIKRSHSFVIAKNKPYRLNRKNILGCGKFLNNTVYNLEKYEDMHYEDKNDLALKICPHSHPRHKTESNIFQMLYGSTYYTDFSSTSMIVMPRLRGTPIHLDISEIKCFEIFINILITYKALHQLGISHRDIQFDNILIDEESFIYPIDFEHATYPTTAENIKIDIDCLIDNISDNLIIKPLLDDEKPSQLNLSHFQNLCDTWDRSNITETIINEFIKLYQSTYKQTPRIQAPRFNMLIPEDKVTPLLKKPSEKPESEEIVLLEDIKKIYLEYKSKNPTSLVCKKDPLFPNYSATLIRGTYMVAGEGPFYYDIEEFNAMVKNICLNQDFSINHIIALDHHQGTMTDYHLREKEKYLLGDYYISVSTEKGKPFNKRKRTEYLKPLTTLVTITQETKDKIPLFQKTLNVHYISLFDKNALNDNDSEFLEWFWDLYYISKKEHCYIHCIDGIILSGACATTLMLLDKMPKILGKDTRKETLFQLFDCLTEHRPLLRHLSLIEEITQYALKLYHYGLSKGYHPIDELKKMPNKESLDIYKKIFPSQKFGFFKEINKYKPDIAEIISDYLEVDSRSAQSL